MKLTSFQEIVDAAENGTLISFEHDIWISFHAFILYILDTSSHKEWNELHPRFCRGHSSSDRNRLFREQLKYVGRELFNAFLNSDSWVCHKPFNELQPHQLWCIDFDKSLTSFPDIVDAVEKQAVICPNPPFWYEFCTFINDQVPIDFCNGEMRPFILDNWHSTNDFEKNHQFKKQLDYLAVEQKEDLVTIFFGRSTPKFPSEPAEARKVWYVNEHPQKTLDSFQLDSDTERLEAEALTEEKVKKAAKVFDLAIREAKKKDKNYGVFEFQTDLEGVAENQTINETALKTFKEKKLLEIFSLFNEQYIFPCDFGLDLSDFSHRVYETWLEE